MKKVKEEKGGITLFVIISILFIMTILIGIYWKSTNYQVTVLQAEQRIKHIYEKDANVVYNELNLDNNNIIL